MQKLNQLIAITVTAFLASISIASGNTDNTPQISVTGTAEITAKPEIMRWQVVVQNQHKSITDVAGIHERDVSNLLSFLAQKGIEIDKTQTSNIELRENWVYRHQSNVFEGYIASTTVIFESNDFEKYKPLWFGITSLNSVRINGVTFDITDENRISFQNQARVNAAKAAEVKAQQLCEVLGSALMEPIRINESSNSNDSFMAPRHTRNVMMSAMPESDAGGSSAIAPGTIKIRSQVSVTFRIARQ